MNRKLQGCIAGVLFSAAVSLPLSAAAQDQTAGGPGEWLSRYTSARTLGMGSAYVATADDPLGILWNPAGLSLMNQNELRFENAKLFEETSVNALGFAVPGSKWPSFGLAMVSLGSGDFQQTNDMNDPLGTFKEGETAWLITGSKAITPRFAIGANFKLVQQTVESFSAQGFGVDMGAIYTAMPGLKLGLSVMNVVGPKLQLDQVEETYPMQVRGGAALQVLNGRGLVAIQLDQSSGIGTTFHTGAEYWIQSGIAFRAGFDDNGASGGLTYRFAPQYQFDYAAANHPLGLQHRVGVAMRFGGFFASSSADPAIFSPTGEHAVTRISMNARTKANPTTWTLEILNKADEIVRRFGGPGQPPSHLEWDGKDEAGMPLPDGTYRYHLIVTDAVGRQVLGPMKSVEISTGGPQGTVPLAPSTENGQDK